MRSPHVALAEGPTAVVPMAPGRVLGGRYELVRQLGAGSMGEVWVARHRTLGERVALKVLSRATDLNRVEDPASSAARFRFEAHVAARLSRGSRHIIRVTDHGEEGPLAYLVMELLEGQTLETLLLRRGPLPTDRLAVILAQVARALDYAHAEGVVHRDLKPANVFLTRDEDGAPLVKVLDFGIARSVRPVPEASAFSTAANVILGTPGYMSPEHATGATPDRHCDLWALAALAYEALTNELPVPGVHAEELIANLRARRFVPIEDRVPSLPRSLAAFFARAFADRLEDRYQSASDLAREFDRAVGGGARSARTVVALRPSVPSPARRRWRSTAVVIAGACAVGAVIAALVSVRPRVSASPMAIPVADVRPAGVQTLHATLAPLTGEDGRHDMSAASAAASAPLRESVAPRPPATPRIKPDCSIPYVFDSVGIKRWKRDCL